MKKIYLILFLFFLTLFLTTVKAQSVIGEFYPSNEIRIEKQDYIDTYFSWQLVIVVITAFTMLWWTGWI